MTTFLPRAQADERREDAYRAAKQNKRARLKKDERSRRAKRAGEASGRSRRARSTCRRPPRVRSRQGALALAYQQPGISRAQFDEAWVTVHPRPVEAPLVAYESWERGRETAWMQVRALERWWRAAGQHFAHTNTQLQATMAGLGQDLSVRQIQRIRLVLKAMGYGVAVHVRRGQATPGNRDYLRFERRWTGRCLCVSTQTGVILPKGARTTPPSGKLFVLAGTSKTTALAPPPSAADDVGAPAGALGIEGAEGQADSGFPEPISRLGFLQMKLDLAPALFSAHNRRELNSLLAGGSGHDTSLTASITSNGFK